MSNFRGFAGPTLALTLILTLTAPAVRAQRPLRITPPVIVIDPGHASEVSDKTVVQNGTTEMHIAWEVSRRLRRLLTAHGYQVVMTKNSERQPKSNAARAGIGNRVGAALVVRLHCDGSADGGYALYYPDRAATVQGRTGPSASVIRRSRAAADSLHASMARVLRGRLKDGGVRGDSKIAIGAGPGALTGSVFSEVPVVLVEMATLNDASDARFITDERGQSLMAQAIAEGIGRFVPASNSPRTWR